MAPANTAVSAQRVRAAFSFPTGAAALLQRGLPQGGAEVVALEGAATLPGNDGGQAEPQRPKPALPGAGPQPEPPGERGAWRGREGNH